MSHFKCKSISMNEKKNEITLTVADSSLRPLSFKEIALRADGSTYEEKCKELFEQLYSGNVQPYQSANRGIFYAAEIAWQSMLKTKYGYSLKDLWDFDYKARCETNQTLKQKLLLEVSQIKNECYECWIKSLNEQRKRGTL